MMGPLQAIMAAMAALPLAALGSRKTADEALKATVAEAGVRQFLLQNLLPDEQRWCVTWRLRDGYRICCRTSIAGASAGLAAGLTGWLRAQWQ